MSPSLYAIARGPNPHTPYTRSSFEVITTCSPHNFALVKSYGADHIYDYQSTSSLAESPTPTCGNLTRYRGCISTPGPGAICAAVLAPGAIYSSIGIAQSPRGDVKTEQTLGYSFLGEPWEQMGQSFPASREDLEFSMAFAGLSERLLAQGIIRPHPVDLREGGLEAVPQGIEDLRAKKISGKKIAVKVNGI